MYNDNNLASKISAEISKLKYKICIFFKPLEKACLSGQYTSLQIAKVDFPDLYVTI